MASTATARLLPALRALGYAGAVALVAVMGVRAARDVRPGELSWWVLAAAIVPTVAWWTALAGGWALVARGRLNAADVGTWCRTQPLRFLPGGIWAPASRAAAVRGGWRDKLSTVAAENLVALCAALAIAGVALAAARGPAWAALVPAAALPVAAASVLGPRTRVDSRRALRATACVAAGFAAYAAAAALVQAAVSGGDTDVLAAAGAATLAWAAGLVVVVAPGGVGVRESAYVALLAGTLPAGELAAGAVAFRLVTVAAELAVLVVAGRPAARAVPAREDREAPAP